MDRHIDFEWIENFRDFGGYDTACGRSVVRGRLFRSGHHHLATDADVAKMRDLGVTAIVDLRHPSERRREPSRRWDGCAATVIESDIETDGPDWVDRLAGAPLTPEWFFEDTKAGYRGNPFQPRHIDLFRRFLHAAADTEGAVVIHCAAGKDRTGIACALLHHVAGVHHDDLMADYLLTNDEGRIQRRIKSAGDWLEKQLGFRVADEAVRVAVTVYPEFLDNAFDAMAEQCGSIDGYVEQVLGITAADRARIHDKVLG